MKFLPKNLKIFVKVNNCVRNVIQALDDDLQIEIDYAQKGIPGQELSLAHMRTKDDTLQ